MYRVSSSHKIRPIVSFVCVGGILTPLLVRTVRKFAMSEECKEGAEGMTYQPSVKHGSVYQNPWGDGSVPSFLEARHLLREKNRSNVPSNEEELNRNLPVRKLSPDVSSPPEKGVRLTWLGHASVLAQFDHFSILADPIFSDRCSPIGIIGPKRFRPAPCNVSELPEIDAVCISHCHYDHLDVQTVKGLNSRFGEKLRWFVPIGLKHWMNNSGCKNVVELDWWAEDTLEKELENGEKVSMRFVFTPTRHWCNRSLLDKNRVLWGSWTVLGPRYRYHFTGDTGYCEAFKQIGHRYGPIDVAAIPIGAYEPRWIMAKQHVHPEESVKIHQDLGAKKSLGIHWGTFTLTYEYYMEPPEKLNEALDEQGISKDDFFTLDHGASRLVLSDADDK